MIPNNDIFSTLKDRWDFTISIIVIVVFSVFIYHYIFPSKEEISNDLANETKDIPIVDSKDNDENKTIDSPSDTFQRSEIKVQDEHHKEIGNVIVITDFEQSASSTSVESDSTISVIQEEHIANRQSNQIAKETPIKEVLQEV